MIVEGDILRANNTTLGGDDGLPLLTVWQFWIPMI